MTAEPDEIVLRNGLLSVAIEPAAGGSLTGMSLGVGAAQFDILRRPVRAPPSPIARSLNLSCFPLMPYAGRLRNGQFDFDGRRVTYPLNALPEHHSSHGDGFTRIWRVVERERASAVIRIEPEPSAPIQYDCSQTITISPGRIDIKFVATNLESRPIPFESGFHPYFAARSAARIQASLPFETHWDGELMPVSRGTNELQEQFTSGIHAASLPVAAEYSGWDGHAVLQWPSAAVTVELQTLPALEHVVVWAPDGEDFFCFEPLSHATDSYNRWRSDPGIRPPRRLLPGESREQAFSFIVWQG